MKVFKNIKNLSNSFILLPYLNEDICLKIENICLKSHFKVVLSQLEFKWIIYWKEKYRNYECKFIHFQKKFKYCYYYYYHNMYLRRIEPYHIIYNDFFNITKSQKIEYIKFY